jgi:TRAP-type C4-dicarboxylate transport system substrate-binding protein
MSTQLTRRQMLRTVGAGIAGTALLGSSACSSEGLVGSSQTKLRLSHQWPKATSANGDFRALLAQKFAQRVAAETNGDVKIQVFPNASLVEAETQYQAISKNTIDMTVYPVVYAVGEHPPFDVTTLPCLIQNHTHAQNWRTAKIGSRIESIFESAGTRILVWNWDSFCMGVNKGPAVVSPDDVPGGSVWRGAGPRLEQLLEKAGASITSMDSSEIYGAMQTGVLDAFITSPSSYRSYRLYEQTSSYTSPTYNTLGFFFEPLLIGLDQFDSLPGDVQGVFEDVAAGLQEFAFGASEDDDMATEHKTEQAGVTVATMGDAAFAQWKSLSEPIWSDFANQVPDGAELVDLAQQVPTT